MAGLIALATTLLVRDGGRQPAPPEPGPQLLTSIELDKRGYTQGETVLAEVTVTNDGPVTAERIVLDCVDAAGTTNVFSTNYLANGEDWLRFTVRGLREVTLAPSESFTTRVSGIVSSNAANVGTLGILCGVTYDGSAGRLVLSQTEATVTGASNAVTGRFTSCQDENHGLDADGAAAAGVRLTLERGYDNSVDTPPEPWSTVTDANGRFTFPVVAAGPYLLRYNPPPGYAPGKIDLLVTGDGLRWQDELTVTRCEP